LYCVEFLLEVSTLLTVTKSKLLDSKIQR